MSEPAPRSWSDVRRILCVRLDTLGDVLMTTPAIRAIRSSVPDSWIALLTSSAGAGVGSLVPEVDEVIVHDAPWMKGTAPGASADADLSMVRRLRAARFDAAVIFTVYSQSPLPAAMLCHLAGIPLRLAHCRENPYQLLTNRVEETEPHAVLRHEVRRQLDLVRTVGYADGDERLSLAVPEAARRSMDGWWDRLGLTGQDVRVVAIHPGATAPSRRSPPDRFAAAGRRLVHEDGCRVLVTGVDEEAKLAEEVAGGIGPGARSIAGLIDLPELAALLERADLLIANNTGPVHIAAAVGTPVVDLYALTNPQHTPWGVPHRVLSRDVPCRWCYRSVCPYQHHWCLRGISADQVVDAARELLGTGSPRPVARLDSAPATASALPTVPKNG